MLSHYFFSNEEDSNPNVKHYKIETIKYGSEEGKQNNTNKNETTTNKNNIKQESHFKCPYNR